MKNALIKTLFLFLLSLAVLNSRAQSPFKSNYLRFGLNQLGKKLDNSLSVPDNLMSGNFGANTGYILEGGHIFYFNKNSDFPVKFGLDLTYVSFTFNKLNWNAYVASKGDPQASQDGAHMAISVGPKLGPVFSFNPVEKLVIDLRVQFSYTAHFFDETYYAFGGEPQEDYFAFGSYQVAESDASFDPEAIKNRLQWTFKPNFGISIRRKIIGLALDYSPGKVNYYYDATDSYGKEKFKVNTLQLKLSLNF